MNRCPACRDLIIGPSVVIRLPDRFIELHPGCGASIAIGLLTSVGAMREAA